jgi:hypothetical protein
MDNDPSMTRCRASLASTSESTQGLADLARLE